MLLRELFEAPAKRAVLAFGRLNPPTIGHAKLVDAITAQEGDHYLFLSQTQKPKTDPLDFATKIKFAKQFFPGITVGHQAVRTPVQALEQLQSLGYTDVIFIAGSDRVDGFQKLFDTYNGQPDKTGKVPFKFNSIKVVSAGERDPDADGAEGMSASKMRAAAAAGELETFAQGVPDKKLAKTLYDAVRKGMGVKDAVATETDLNELLDLKSNKNFEQLDSYENYELYRSKKKFNDKYFIVQAVHPRTRKIVAKTSDGSRNGAEAKMHAELDKLSTQRKRVTGNATVDFNVEFAKQILSEPGETFYAKIISGPKLVLAGAEMLEYPEIMKDEGFKKSAIRNVNSPEGTTRLPSIPLGAKQASAANVVANGRYLVGNQSKDKDENLVFDLNFDSEVYSKGDKVRIKKPALTIGTNRNESFDEDVSPEDEDSFHNELDDLVHKYFGDSPDEEKMKKKYKKTDEILGFATKRPKTATITKKRPPEEDSVQDKIKKRRALASKVGVDKAFKHDSLKGK